MPFFAMGYAYVINGERGFNYGLIALSLILVTIGSVLADKSILRSNK